MRTYVFWQNGSALLAACLGWLWIPNAGLAAYLTVRFLYVFMPLVGFGSFTLKQMLEPTKLVYLTIISLCILALCIVQAITGVLASVPPLIFICLSISIAILQFEDIKLLGQELSGIN